jgi:hypothetical protein
MSTFQFLWEVVDKVPIFVPSGYHKKIVIDNQTDGTK